jgi:alcohol dehydrogenase YqhD (iron-dependent ADH family)
MMSHIFERYFTNEKGVDLTDRLCESVLLSIMDAALIVKNNPYDYNARATLMWAGTVAHVNLLGLGRIEDWGAHALEHELSALYDIAHGAGLAIVYPAWMRYQLSHDPARFAQLASRVFHCHLDKANPELTARKGIFTLSAFWSDLGLPSKLREISGFHEKDIPLMTKKIKMTRPGELGNFRPLSYTDVKKIYHSMV